eukprot:TRINITY_DN60105_c0_g1_i1.p1 TRINITY_DN60105_c0_g1~~TRINITY_DN60105_c0_g1_i1.p1  ORF type:complete len:161 (+),score=24.58 TRINITY_DN60105_c0_g1_i1:36-518(+)
MAAAMARPRRSALLLAAAACAAGCWAAGTILASAFVPPSSSPSGIAYNSKFLRHGRPPAEVALRAEKGGAGAAVAEEAEGPNTALLVVGGLFVIYIAGVWDAGFTSCVKTDMALEGADKAIPACLQTSSMVAIGGGALWLYIAVQSLFGGPPPPGPPPHA